MGLGLGMNLTKGAVSEAFTWIPTDVAGLAVWHRNGTDYTDVAQWDDSSGNNNHAIQETAENQAEESDGGLYFNGSSDYYEYTESIDLASDDSFTMAIVYNLDSTDVKNTIWSKDANNAFIEFKDADTVKFNYSSSIVELDGGTHTADSVRSMIVTRLGASGAHKLYEGSSTAVTTGTQTGAATFVNLGVRNDNDRWFDGKIYEVMIWDNVNFKGDNLDNLIQYINNVQNSIGK
jgi:hypothetical protein